MKFQFITFLNTYGKSKVIVLTVLMLVVAYTNVASAATLKLPPTNLGLVGYWPMDEGVGSVTKDISGSGNNATFTGGPTWTTGKFGQALQFSGGLVFARNNNFTMGSNPIFTVSGWFKRTGSMNGKGAWGIGGGSITGQTISGYDNNGENIGIDLWGTATFYVNYSYPLNQWVHVVWIKTGTAFSAATTDIYVNGVKQTTLTSRGTSHTPSLTNGVTIGGISPNDAIYNGPVINDDLRIYNRAISAAEVQQLYSAGVAKMNTSSTNKNTSGLVGYWTFDGADTTTTTATDKSGSGNNGTLTNGPTMALGKIGQSLVFNGSNFVNIGSFGSFPPQGTMSFWVNASEMANYRNPLATGSGNTGIRFEENALGNFVVVTGNDIGTYDSAIYLTSGMLANTWYHISYIWDVSSNTEKGYLNGVQVFSNGHSLWPTALPSFRIGKGFTDSSERWWKGRVDDTRIYNRVLSVSEIQQLYNTGAGSKVNSAQNSAPSSSLTSGLVGYWPFNGIDISGTTAYDRSTSGNNGTLVNGPTVALGKMGQAIKFDGNLNYISAPNTSSLQPLSGNWSVGFWINRSGLGSGDYPEVIGSRPWSTGTDKGWAVSYSSSDNKIGAHYADGSTGFDVTATKSVSTVSLNAWQHWVVVFDRTNSKLNYYLNGQLDVQQTPAFPSGSINQTDVLYMGREISGSNFRKLNAKIDEVRVYNRVLSATEVKQLYLLGK